MEDFDKIFFQSKKFTEEELLLILFPLHQMPPWSNQRPRIKEIVTKVHSVLETSHSEKFKNQETLDVLLRFRKQMRLSYYIELANPDNIPNHDRDFYIANYENIVTYSDEQPAREVQSEQHFIEQQHQSKMLTFITQDSYEVTKNVYGVEIPTEDAIPYFVGFSKPPRMLDVTKFEEVYVERTFPGNLAASNVNDQDEGVQSDSSVKLSIK